MTDDDVKLEPCPFCRVEMRLVADLYHRHPHNKCILQGFTVTANWRNAWNKCATHKSIVSPPERAAAFRRDQLRGCDDDGRPVD